MEEDTKGVTENISFADALVQESPDALIALSPAGKILFWNNGAEILFGYSRKEALGLLLDELVIPPDHREKARRAMADSLDGKTVLFESVRRRKDGSHVDVDVSQRAVKDAQGRILFVAATTETSPSSGPCVQSGSSRPSSAGCSRRRPTPWSSWTRTGALRW
jgi:PAS domain S-box-containing protein